MLFFADDGGDDGDDGFAEGLQDGFSLSNCLWIPGPKHMIDNIIGDTLGRLEAFKEFQSSLKACTETWCPLCPLVFVGFGLSSGSHSLIIFDKLRLENCETRDSRYLRLDLKLILNF